MKQEETIKYNNPYIYLFIILLTFKETTILKIPCDAQ